MARLSEQHYRDALDEARNEELTADRTAACMALLDAHDRAEAAEARVRALVAALTQITKGEGRFSRDPLTHASNTIEDMIQLAERALAAERGDDDAP